MGGDRRDNGCGHRWNNRGTTTTGAWRDRRNGHRDRRQVGNILLRHHRRQRVCYHR